LLVNPETLFSKTLYQHLFIEITADVFDSQGEVIKNTLKSKNEALYHITSKLSSHKKASSLMANDKC
jgi:hypothetical protein